MGLELWYLRKESGRFMETSFSAFLIHLSYLTYTRSPGGIFLHTFYHSYETKWMGIQESLLRWKCPKKHNSKNWVLWYHAHVLRSLRFTLFNGCHGGESGSQTTLVAKYTLRLRNCPVWDRLICLFYVTPGFQRSDSGRNRETSCLTGSTKSPTHFSIIYLGSWMLS